MNGRRAVVGFSLLCALVFCVFTAPSATAAKGTTAFTCVEQGHFEGNFADAHCDIEVTPGTGIWTHEAIGTSATEIEGTNAATNNSTKESTPAVLKTSIGGVNLKITCTTVASTGSLTNEAGPPMKVKGNATIKYAGCTVNEPAKCTVAEPVVAKTNAKSIVISESPEEMGVEFTPETGTTFVEIELKNSGAEVCAVKGKFKVTGSVIGTPGKSPNGKGATLHFSSFFPGMINQKFGGNSASLEAVETVRMKGGNPITFTTTAS